MELEELKKSWNALDDKGIHAIARLNIKLILISLPVLVLFLLEVLLHGRLNPIYIIIILSWIPALYWDITTTRFLQQTKVDEMPLIAVISRVNCFPSYTGSTLIYLLADMAIWNSHHSVFYPALGSWAGADLVDLSQEIPEPYSGNQEEPGRT